MSSVKCFVAVPSVAAVNELPLTGKFIAAVSMIDSGPDFHLTHYL